MIKLIITETQLRRVKERLIEEINPEDAYNDEGSIKTLFDGNRNIAFIHDKKLVSRANKLGFKIIRVKQPGMSAFIVYRNGSENEAQQLFSIARKNNGYLPIKNPEETYVIGILLGYDEDRVKQFVLNKFPNFNFY